jgi:para-nitrobenzyl esterase
MTNPRTKLNSRAKSGMSDRRSFLAQASLLVAGAHANLSLPLTSGTGHPETPTQAYTGPRAGPEAIVDTTSGMVRGMKVDGIATFLGIPYAGDTSGRNRFMPPSKPASWGAIRDAFTYGPRCPQRDTTSDTAAAVTDWYNQPGREGEDCLVLNVWTPGIKDSRKRPVMFWLHGGGFHQGSAAQAYYDGKALCHRGDVVVVTSNHRLASMGYLYLAELGGSDYAQSSNVGMLDIVAALEWVRDNIENFGGDPGNVMIFGVSGGGSKVSNLHAMPAAKGLFHRAVIESGPGLRSLSRDQASASAEKLLAALGIDKTHMDELHNVPIARLLDAQTAAESQSSPAVFSPVVDGTTLPRNPFDPDAPEISADVPLIIGTNKTEATYFMINELDAVYSLDEGGLETRLRPLLKDNTANVISAYRRIYPKASPTDLMIQISTDQRMRINSITLAERKAALRRGPVYMYMWAWHTPVMDGRLRSPHGGEMPFVFDTTDVAYSGTGGGPEARALAAKMSSAWIAFARSGNPNIKELPHWEAYTTDNRATMMFDNASQVVNDPDGGVRSFWQQQMKT